MLYLYMPERWCTFVPHTSHTKDCARPIPRTARVRCLEIPTRAHTYIINEQYDHMAGKRKSEPETKAGIVKGQATGKAPKPKPSIASCSRLYEVMQVRGVKGATLNTIDECIGYVAEYMDFCEANPFVSYEIMKGGNMAGEKIPVDKKRAPSVGGFCLFIGWSIKEFNKNMEKLEKLAADGDPDAGNLYLGYCLIKELITTEMDESALAGMVDATYMAKLRGLRDLKDVTSNGKEAGTKAMQVNVLSSEAVDNLKRLGGI